jgi:hypothetical protein
MRRRDTTAGEQVDVAVYTPNIRNLKHVARSVNVEMRPCSVAAGADDAGDAPGCGLATRDADLEALPLA